MNLHVLNIVLAVITAVGIPGAIALAVFAPALAEAIFAGFLNVFGRVVGTPIGAGIVCCVIGLLVGELYGGHQADLRCQATMVAKEKAADAAAVERDKQQAQIRSTEDQAAIDQLTSLNQTNEAKINDYVQQLAKSKGTACLLTPDDVQRLR